MNEHLPVEERVGRYLHGCTKNVTRWQSIRMSNLADDIPIELIPKVMEEVTIILRREIDKTIKRLEELNCPPIIMVNYVKMSDKIKDTKHPWQSTLVRSLNRRSK